MNKNRSTKRENRRYTRNSIASAWKNEHSNFEEIDAIWR